MSNSNHGFLNLGRGNKINKSLVDYVATSKGRYFVKDIYGGSYEVDRKHLEGIISVMGHGILKKKENR